MRKLFLLTLLFCFLYTRSNAQQSNSAKTLQIGKTELFSSKDIKPLLAIAYPDKDYTYYGVQSFNLSGTTIEEGIPVFFGETSSCGTLTEKQLSLIEKYNKQGMVFTLQEINLREKGKPGTPYNPAGLETISVPNILFSIKE